MGNYQGSSNGGETGSGSGDYDVAPTIELDLNFEKLEILKSVEFYF